MQVKESDFKEVTVLFAEDDETVLENIGYSLRSYFKEAYLAKDGIEAFRLYEAHSPDIVLTDIRMPGKDGIELIKEIREQDRDIPIVVFSAYSDADTLLEAVRLYLSDYLIKPISYSKLLGVLTKCIRTLPKMQERYFHFDATTRYSFIAKEIEGKECVFPLSNYEIRLLELLISKKNEVVSYGVIESEVWSDEYMSKDAIKSLVKKLRRKLPQGSIKNIVDVGYRLITE